MSTKALIDRIVPQLGAKYSRSTGTRSILNDIQEAMDELTSTVAPFRIYRGADNLGLPPYLKTAASTFDYEIIPANLSTGTLTKKLNGSDYEIKARVVTRVLVDVSTANQYGIRWVGKPFIYSAENPYGGQRPIRVAEITISAVPYQDGTPPRIHFFEQPVVSDTTYMVEFTYLSPRLGSESIPLDVPREFETALEDYVVGMNQMRENGKYGDRITRFFEYWKPEFEIRMGIGASISDNQTPSRTC